MDESALKVFISHSNKAKDHGLVNREVIPKLERNNITIRGQNDYAWANFIAIHYEVN